MPERQSSKDRLREITEGLEDGLKNLFQSEKYADYLQTMSRFHRYSVNNIMLIQAQKPGATRVAGFNKWKDQFGRYVKRGEKGIQIIAPAPITKKIDEIRRDPETKAPLLDKNGNVVMEEKVVKIPMFKVVSVFDISQTDGKPLPELASDLTGDVRQFDIFMEALRRSSPVPIKIQTIDRNMDGFFSPADQNIAIRNGMSEVQTVSAAIHEIAHSKLHNYRKTQIDTDGDEAAENAVRKDRNTEEVEAESISYTVCQYYGIQTAENSFGYIASWSEGKEMKELRSSLETINKTSAELIDDIDRNFREICKERDVDPKAEKEADPSVDEDEKSEAEIKEAEAENTVLKPEMPSFSEQTEEKAETQVSEEHNTEDTVTEAIPAAPEEVMSVPMPDPMLTFKDMERYGYADTEMLPLSKDRALELAEKDIPVYMLHGNNTEEMAFDTDEILAHEGLFGITHEDWEAARADIPERNVEMRFMEQPKDAFMIYQLSEEAPRGLRFAGLAEIGTSPARDNYEAVYTGILETGLDPSRTLENIYTDFNIHRPRDFTGHSLSVSDVIALKQDGIMSYHYCDSFGFTELSDFCKPENHLKNAEMTMEDDYGMIDGIINNGEKQPTVAELEQQARSGKPISLMDLANAIHREQKKETIDTKEKPSILTRLKNKPVQQEKKDTHQISAEREM